MEQKEAWESFYESNNRPWRGVSDLREVPFEKGSHVIEIGCGNGKTAAALSDLGMRVIGLDFSRAAIDMCLKQSIKNAEFACADVLSIPFDDRSFDGAVVFHILEHLTEAEQKVAVKEITRVLKPGSSIMVRVFAKGDLRSDKGEAIDDSTVVRGNGIMYHYYTEDELCQIFKGTECVSIATINEDTRFGETRSRISAVFKVIN